MIDETTIMNAMNDYLKEKGYNSTISHNVYPQITVMLPAYECFIHINEDDGQVLYVGIIKDNGTTKSRHFTYIDLSHPQCFETLISKLTAWSLLSPDQLRQ